MQLLKCNCERDSVEYPWLGEMLDLYGYYNYNAPNSVEELISFTEELHQLYPDDIYYFETLKQITFPKLLKINVSFSKDNCTLTALLNDEILAESEMFFCCDSVEYYTNDVDWDISQRNKSKRVCFYNESNKLILENDSLKNSFIENRNKWMAKYDIINPYSMSSVYYDKYVLVEYRRGEGLQLLCSDHDDALSDNFWKDLDRLLLDFCSHHKISKMIFLQGIVETRKNWLKFPYLADIVDDYFSTNYRFPDTISELIDFVEYSSRFASDYYPEPDKSYVLNTTLPKLKKYSDEIKIVNSDDLIITIEKDTLLCYANNMMPFSPCDIKLFIGDEPMEYASFHKRFSNPRFFNKSGKAVLVSDSLNSIFTSTIKKIQKKYLESNSGLYHSYTYENRRIPIYIFLEYELNKGLYNFCDREKPICKMVYYKMMEEYFKQFCEEFNLSRIIFMTPDYYIDDINSGEDLY